jgi:hypothetical protein
MKRYLLGAVAAALLAASPATGASSKNVAGYKGVVVARTASSLAVAGANGVVRTAHVRSSVRVGTVVSVSGARVAVLGVAHRAVIRGVAVRRLGSTQFLAAGGSMVAVKSRRGLAAVGGNGPSPGTEVQDTVAVNAATGTLTTQSTTTLGTTSSVSVQATITSVNVGSVTISVNGQSLTLPLPAGLTLPATVVGSTVSLTLNLSGGSPTATPGTGDDEQDGDNNDDNGDIGQQGDNQGGQQGDD